MALSSQLLALEQPECDSTFMVANAPDTYDWLSLVEPVSKQTVNEVYLRARNYIQSKVVNPPHQRMEDLPNFRRPYETVRFVNFSKKDTWPFYLKILRNLDEKFEQAQSDRSAEEREFAVEVVRTISLAYLIKMNVAYLLQQYRRYKSYPAYLILFKSAVAKKYFHYKVMRLIQALNSHSVFAHRQKNSLAASRKNLSDVSPWNYAYTETQAFGVSYDKAISDLRIVSLEESENIIFSKGYSNQEDETSVASAAPTHLPVQIVASSSLNPIYDFNFGAGLDLNLLRQSLFRLLLANRISLSNLRITYSYFMNPEATDSQVADLFGVSRQSASKAYTAVTRELKKHFKDDLEFTIDRDEAFDFLGDSVVNSVLYPPVDDSINGLKRYSPAQVFLILLRENLISDNVLKIIDRELENPALTVENKFIFELIKKYLQSYISKKPFYFPQELRKHRKLAQYASNLSIKTAHFTIRHFTFAFWSLMPDFFAEEKIFQAIFEITSEQKHKAQQFRRLLNVLQNDPSKRTVEESSMMSRIARQLDDQKYCDSLNLSLVESLVVAKFIHGVSLIQIEKFKNIYVMIRPIHGRLGAILSDDSQLIDLNVPELKNTEGMVLYNAALKLIRSEEWLAALREFETE